MAENVEDTGFGGFGSFSEFLDNFHERPLPLIQSLRYRKGGSPSSWADPGGTIYAPSNGFLQAGSCEWSGAAATSGALTVDLPSHFADTPLILVAVTRTWPLLQDVRCQAYASASSLEIAWHSAVALTSVYFNWLVLGPAGV